MTSPTPSGRIVTNHLYDWIFHLQLHFFICGAKENVGRSFPPYNHPNHGLITSPATKTQEPTNSSIDMKLHTPTLVLLTLFSLVTSNPAPKHPPRIDDIVERFELHKLSPRQEVRTASASSLQIPLTMLATIPFLAVFGPVLPLLSLAVFAVATEEPVTLPKRQGCFVNGLWADCASLGPTAANTLSATPTYSLNPTSEALSILSSRWSAGGSTLASGLTPFTPTAISFTATLSQTSQLSVVASSHACFQNGVPNGLWSDCQSLYTQSKTASQSTASTIPVTSATETDLSTSITSESVLTTSTASFTSTALSTTTTQGSPPSSSTHTNAARSLRPFALPFISSLLARQARAAGVRKDVVSPVGSLPPTTFQALCYINGVPVPGCALTSFPTSTSSYFCVSEGVTWEGPCHPFSTSLPPLSQSTVLPSTTSENLTTQATTSTQTSSEVSTQSTSRLPPPMVTPSSTSSLSQSPSPTQTAFRQSNAASLQEPLRIFSLGTMGASAAMAAVFPTTLRKAHWTPLDYLAVSLGPAFFALVVALVVESLLTGGKDGEGQEMRGEMKAE